MDYGNLIARSWRLTWQHRFLWVLGLFAASRVGSCAPLGGGSGGSGLQWRTGPGDLEQLPPGLDPALRRAGVWLAQNMGLVTVLVAVALALALALVVLSLVAQGGMARATADVALGQNPSPGAAWRAGLHLFWRYVGLSLLALAPVLLIVLGIAVVVGLAFVAGQEVGGAPRTVLMVLGALLGGLLALLALPFFLGLSVAVAFAQRAIAIEDAGPIAALRYGFRLLWRHPGTSLLVWLLNLALGLGAGLLIGLGVVALLLPLGVLAVVFFTVAGLSTPLAIYMVSAVAVLVAAVWFLGSIANSYFWIFWTLVYLNLTERVGRDLSPSD